MKTSVLEYLGKYGIDIDRIANRYIQILKMMHKFINEFDLKEKIHINGRSLKETIIDYFIDTVRIKEFHKIQNTNKEKIYAYMAYWLLRRKPLQTAPMIEGYEFVNEVFIVGYINTGISETKKISEAQKEKNPTHETFRDLLFYNLKYRPISQQSLELMLGAFFCGYDFTAVQGNNASVS